MPKITETFARKVPQTRSGTAKHWDSEIKGLALFVGKRSKTWYFQRDIGGQTKRTLIGRFPTITATAARQTAMGLALETARGAGKQIQMGAPTLTEAMEIYLARPKLRSEEYKRSVRDGLNLHMKDWLKLPLDEITKTMVVRRHQEMSKHPVSANRTLRMIRSIWNHTRRTHDLAECPTMAIEWFEEKPSGIVIDDLKAWASEVEALFNPIHKVFYEFLLFTGLRKTEALTLDWTNIREDRIHLPITKNGRSFDLPINQRHHEILAPMRGLSPTWVFPSPKSDSGRITNPEKLTWSPHAHRRTFATVAMEAGVMEEVVGRLLNHTPLSITGQRYVKPSLDALRPSMNQISSELDARLRKRKSRT